MDIVSGPFWYEGPDWTKKHAFYEPKEFNINGYSDNFFVYAYDFNGDGWKDILVLGFPGKEARLYINPGKTAEDKPWNNQRYHVPITLPPLGAVFLRPLPPPPNPESAFSADLAAEKSC